MDNKETLLVGAAVVTPDAPARGAADVRVRGGRIVEIGPDLAPGDAEVVDAAGRIVIPGLVNAHVHLWQTSVRGMGLDWSDAEFHYRMQTDFVPALTPDDIRDAEELGALALLDAGVTAVYDWCHGARTPEHSIAAVEGLGASGIRGVFGHGTVKTSPAPGERHFSEIPHDADLAAAVRAAVDRFPLLKMSLAILGPNYSALEVVRADLRLAADLDVSSSAHVAGSVGKTPDGYRSVLAEGLLRTPHNVVHALALSDEELRGLVAAGASITATPAIEVQESYGLEPLIRRVIEAGGRPSIGTDSEATVAGDMLHTLRTALMLQRMFDKARIDPASVPGAGRPATNTNMRGMGLPPRKQPGAADALRWASADGARALGLEPLAGTISVGAPADLVVIDGRMPNLVPALNPTDAVVGFAHPGNVEAVMVAGRWVKRDGRLIASARVDELSARARAASARILRSTGLDHLRNVVG